MSELQGFPMVSQLDGSLNQQFDCVAASITAALRYYEPGKPFSTDATKNAAYSQSYTGPTEAYKYVDYCERAGVQLYPVSGDLVAIAHAALANNQAVLVTEQDDYAPPQYRDSWTHVCVIHKDRPGYLTAMDPYIGRDIEYSDEQWRQRMRSDCVWVMRRGGKMALHFVNGWLREAKEYNINQNSWDRGGVKATHLVIHGTAGGSTGDGTMAYMGGEGVSTHFAISTNGDIWQGVSCDRAAWGNAPFKSPRFNFDRADLNPNEFTVSVEFCKPDSTNQVNITDAQKASGFPLIAAICETYSIDKRRGDGHGGIISHADINSVDRSMCPGTFPWDEMMAYLANTQQGGQNDMLSTSDPWVARYYDDLGNGQLRDKTSGVVVGGNILKYILMTQFACRLVLTNEQSIGKQAKYVVGEAAITMFDPGQEFDHPSMPNSYGCYFVKLTSDLARNVIAKDLFDKIAAYQQQIASLQQQLASTQNANVEQLQAQIQDLTTKLSSAKSALAQIATEAATASK